MTTFAAFRAVAKGDGPGQSRGSDTGTPADHSGLAGALVDGPGAVNSGV